MQRSHETRLLLLPVPRTGRNPHRGQRQPRHSLDLFSSLQQVNADRALVLADGLACEMEELGELLWGDGSS
jgi:hypothetical protein